jgi:hypothetical protein
MKPIKLNMTGTSPLLLSCDQLADPIDPLTIMYKELTSKRKKTKEDHLLIARSQWQGLLYWNDDIGVYVPTQNIRAALVGGATLNKLGMQINRGTLMMEEHIALDYGKKLTPDQLWEQQYVDRRNVVVSRARIPAYRPKFFSWQLNFEMLYDETMLDENQILQSFENAGKFVGIGGFRPEKGGTFGRFEIKKLN